MKPTVADKGKKTLLQQESKDDSWKIHSNKGLLSFTSQMRKILKPLILKKGFVFFDLLSSWKDIVGDEMAQGVRPEKVTYPKGERTNGTLYVKAADGSFALSMEYKKQAVICAVNRLFGYQVISKVRISQGLVLFKPVFPPVPKKEILNPDEEAYLRQSVSNIENEDIRTGLERLGRLIMLKDKKKKKNKLVLDF
jgi:hypothetical protein